MNNHGISSYVDLHIDESDWQGCHGAFVLAAGDGHYENVPFSYCAKTHTLTTGQIDYDALVTYRDTFLADAREAWQSNCDELRGLN